MGIELTMGRAFVFFNKTHRNLKIYFKDDTGDQSVEKLLLSGKFLVPMASGEQPYVMVSPEKLSTLFR